MDGNENRPSASVTTSRVNPVSVWMAVTLAPGRTPPLESLTVPLICAVAWARAPVAVNVTSRPLHNRQLRTRFIAASWAANPDLRARTKVDAVATRVELYTSERGGLTRSSTEAVA